MYWSLALSNAALRGFGNKWRRTHKSFRAVRPSRLIAEFFFEPLHRISTVFDESISGIS